MLMRVVLRVMKDGDNQNANAERAEEVSGKGK
jgi:hypothetical protein